MLFADKLSFDNPRMTADGYMVVRARAARAGIYEYNGRDIDPEGRTFTADQVVRVYRPEEEVFNADSVASFLMKPVTNDHPSQPVTADNWREHAKGVVGKALRDGEYLAFDIVLMDKATIADVESGKRELSNGYASEIQIGDGTTPEGARYDAMQTSIRGNHVAIVDKGRAGPRCRIGDAVHCDKLPGADLIAILTDERTYTGNSIDNINEPSPRGPGHRHDGEPKMHILVIDGLQVTEVSDQAKAAIEKLQGQLTKLQTDKAAADTKVGELTATVSTKDGEIAALEQKLKDAEVSPAKLEQLAADRATLINQAKTLVPNVVTDGKTDAEIRKAVVEDKLGDAAKDLDDGAVAGAFKAFAKDAPGTDPVRDALSSGVRTNTNDSGASVRDAARAMQY